MDETVVSTPGVNKCATKRTPLTRRLTIKTIRMAALIIFFLSSGCVRTYQMAGARATAKLRIRPTIVKTSEGLINCSSFAVPSAMN
jgi:hypothetical protein